MSATCSGETELIYRLILVLDGGTGHFTYPFVRTIYYEINKTNMKLKYINKLKSRVGFLVKVYLIIINVRFKNINVRFANKCEFTKI